jgi:hypothetical protein
VLTERHGKQTPFPERSLWGDLFRHPKREEGREARDKSVHERTIFEFFMGIFLISQRRLFGGFSTSELVESELKRGIIT